MRRVSLAGLTRVVGLLAVTGAPAQGDGATPSPSASATPSATPTARPNPLPGSSPGGVVTAELVRGPVPRGLEARLPDVVPWQRALAAAREGRFRQAAERFRIAGAQLRALASPCDAAGRGCEGRLSRAEVRRLLRLAALAEHDARTMQIVLRELGATGAGSSVLADVVIRGAGALRRLYLLDRAFRGVEDPALRERARTWYDKLSTASTEEVRARGRLGLACLRADGGDRAGALALLAEVPESQRGPELPELVDLLAHLHAELGEIDRAFEVLAAARDALPEWEEMSAVLRISNDLDALRGDPRFARLLGEP